jgi:hypothetical protein
MRWISSARVSRSTGGLRVLAALAFVAAAGCHSLEVTNPNDPDLTRALASGGDVQNLLAGGFNKWYHSFGDVQPGAPLDVTADHYESAWGNWGMKLMGWEPRLYEMINSHTDPFDNFRGDIEWPWYQNYAAVVAANLVVTAMGNGVKIPGPVDSTSNPMVLAAARFLQGAALANIALRYDSGYAFDENTDPTAIELVGRDSVKNAALVKLDAAISLATGATSAWSIPTNFLNQTTGNWSNTMLAQAANTWAARLLAYFPHNTTENGQVPWAQVESYASKGISSGTPFDMEIVGDGPGTPNGWWNDHTGISGAVFDWMRVSVRTVCLLQTGYECHRPNDNTDLPFPQSPDYRFNGDDVVGDNCVSADNAAAIQAQDAAAYPLHCSAAGSIGGADFAYMPINSNTWPGFPAARGYWRFSNVAQMRYYAPGWDSPDYAVGELPFVLAAENDLLWAEALVMQSNKNPTLAATLINKTHNGRGHLTDITAASTAAQLMAAIRYEVGIELFGVGEGVAWFDQRRWGPDLNPTYYSGSTGDHENPQTGWTAFGTGLQPGSVRLLPVPQQELTLIGHPVYTFGGPNYPEPPAPPVRGAPVVQGTSSIFGTTADGRVITGPGYYYTYADSLVHAAIRNHRAIMSSFRQRM